jgi:hypothetical protein
MAKRVRISPDDGVTFYTFPGNTAELTREGQDLKDTIFGQNYESGMTGLFSAAISANGLYKGYAGYMAVIKKSGSSTVFTDEATTLVSGKTYKITNAVKNVWNRAVAVVVEDGGVAIDAADIESIDYLHGRVTLDSGYTPSGAITFTGAYFPMTQVAKGRSYNLTQTANAIDNSTFETVQANGGYRTFEPGLKTVKLGLTGVYATSNAFEALLAARAEAVIEINADGQGKSIARGWFRPMSLGQSGDVGDLEEQTLDFTLAVPDQEDIILPFSWLHDATSTLNRAIKEALLAWQNDTATVVDYLPDGTNGFEADAIVTDLSLSGGMEAMNEFTVKFQLSGAPAVTP